MGLFSVGFRVGFGNHPNSSAILQPLVIGFSLVMMVYLKKKKQYYTRISRKLNFLFFDLVRKELSNNMPKGINRNTV
jgi:hypothetical protein